MIEVAGARLHTEQTGKGPALLLIPGGGGDAGVYAEVISLLAQRFTVLSYDRRGNSRSPLTDPSATIDVAAQAADAVAVLDHYDVDRGYVFGSSSGAIITVELVAHHGHRLLGAVAHEPPLVQLMPEGSQERKAVEHIYWLAQHRGPMRAFAAFAAMTLPDPPPLLRSPVGQTASAAAFRVAVAISTLICRLTRHEQNATTRLLGNAKLLTTRELPAFCFNYRPDLDALAQSPAPWRLATGRDSTGKPYHQPPHLLAQHLDMHVAEVPGGHTPYLHQPEQFTPTLTRLLAEVTR